MGRRRRRLLFGSGSPTPVILLSGSNVFSDASVGDTVGTLSVINGSGSYTFTLTADAHSYFAIATAALKVDASLSAGTDALTVKADNGTDPFFTQPFTITITDRPSGVHPTYFILGF